MINIYIYIHNFRNLMTAFEVKCVINDCEVMSDNVA